MKLIPTNHPAATWLADIDRLFGSFLGTPHGSMDDGVAVFDRDDAWVLQLDLPGFRKEEVKVTAERGVLEVLAATTEEDRPFRDEIRRSWTLGEDVAADKIEARLELGVLEVTLPKREPVPPAQHAIEVR